MNYLFENMSSYDTPENKPVSLMFRLMLRSRLYFYFHNFGTFIRFGKDVKKGRTGIDRQIELSNRNIDLIEQCGGKIHLRGLNHLRDLNHQPTVIVGNHMSLLECAVLHAICRYYIDFSFVVKKSLLEIPYFKEILRSMEAIPVTRSNPREDLRVMLIEGKKMLLSGKCLFVFPQATRSVEFKPELFNSIGVKLAKSAGVPVMPMAIKTNFIENGKLIRDLGPIHPERDVWFEFGEPMTVEGNGAEQQQRIVDFIQPRVTEWLKMDKEKKC